MSAVQLKAGARFRSAVCDTEVIVVRAPAGEVDLCCGGHPMIPHADPVPSGLSVAEGFGEGSATGKRHADEALGLEVLVTKAGAGSLSIGESILPIKDAKPLPASD